MTKKGVSHRFREKVTDPFFLVLALCVLWPANARAADEIPELSKNRQVYFSPQGGSEQATASAIDLAQATLLVQSYKLSSPRIARAIVEAFKRGVAVQAVLDQEQLKASGSQADLLIRAGIPVWKNSDPSMPRNTTMVIDAKTVITGTFTFTAPPGQLEPKDLLIIDDVMLAAQYARDWNKRRQLCKLYT